jgi:hypothetical protein
VEFERCDYFFQLANIASRIESNSVTLALNLPSLLERDDVVDVTQQLEKKETPRKSETRRSSLASQVRNIFKFPLNIPDIFFTFQVKR